MKGFKIFWFILGIGVLIGGLIWFILNLSIVNYFIWAGVCIVWDLPMVFLAVKEDATGSGRIVTLIFVVLLSPLMVFWQLINTVRYRTWNYNGSKKKKNGKNVGGSHGNGGNASNGNRKTDNSLISSAMANAVDRAIDSVKRNGGYGYYGRIESWNIKRNVARFCGIEVYGEVVYKLTNYSNPNLNENDFKADLEDVLDKINNSLLNAVQREAERVQQEYVDFDGEWQIKINVAGRITV